VSLRFSCHTWVAAAEFTRSGTGIGVEQQQQNQLSAEQAQFALTAPGLGRRMLSACVRQHHWLAPTALCGRTALNLVPAKLAGPGRDVDAGFFEGWCEPCSRC
jgi:hypothetical protein